MNAVLIGTSHCLSAVIEILSELTRPRDELGLAHQGRWLGRRFCRKVIVMRCP